MLQILKPGIFSTIQDAGRMGYQQYGVIVSGVMDSVAFRIGNALLQQHNKPALEMTLYGGEFRFTKATSIALTGGKLHATVNGRAIAMNTVISIQANDVLKCGSIMEGTRSYLCIAGGFTVEKILKSTSTYEKAGFGGYEGRALQAGDAIPYSENTQLFNKTQIAVQHFYTKGPIRVLQGTEWAQFNIEAQETFLQQPYTISLDSNRMGYRLQGALPIQTKHKTELLSEAVTFGTIQLPANGQPIVLMADHQTIGGYPKIAQIIGADLHRMAQLRPNETLTFEQVSLQQAEHAYFKLEQQLRLIEALLQ